MTVYIYSEMKWLNVRIIELTQWKFAQFASQHYKTGIDDSDCQPSQRAENMIDYFSCTLPEVIKLENAERLCCDIIDMTSYNMLIIFCCYIIYLEMRNK